MKIKKGQQGAVTPPLLNDLIERHKVDTANTSDKIASVASKPLKQPALYQDPGGAYSANFVFPQD